MPTVKMTSLKAGMNKNIHAAYVCSHDMSKLQLKLEKLFSFMKKQKTEKKTSCYAIGQVACIACHARSRTVCVILGNNKYKLLLVQSMK